MADATAAGITVLARAKVNLTLHVTGRRADGYHLLDSLVAFADTGDRITVTPAAHLSLKITGKQAGGLSETDNLVVQAARALDPARGARIVLEKTLPVASGLGGGSADAAATLRALSRLWDMLPPPGPAVLRLGADVPACLAGHGLRMEGVGERLTPKPLPEGWLVLVNPALTVMTRDVFAGLARADGAPMPWTLPPLGTVAALAGFLGTMRNDLEPAATLIAPVIADARAALTAQSGCLFARMSGSGATCFGLFAGAREAEAAARAIRRAEPGWWVAAAPMLS